MRYLPPTSCSFVTGRAALQTLNRLLWCQQSLWMVVPPAVVLAVLVWTFLKMDDKITALQKRVEELEDAQKNAEKPEK